MDSFPPVTPIVCRHRNGEVKGSWNSLPGSLTGCAPLAPGNLLAVSFNTSGHDYQFCHEIPCSHFKPLFFLWLSLGLSPSMPGLLMETTQTSFPFLEC